MTEVAKRKYFGTDGMRGLANNGKMNAINVTRLGHAVGIVFSRGKENHRYRVLIGKDTRKSNYTLEPALTAGFTSVGMDVLLTGPIPTPAVARLTDSMRADVGVMISASHNPYYDNGIKLFGPDGYKLTQAQELEIESLMDDPNLAKMLAEPHLMGSTLRIDDATGRYVEFAKNSLPKLISFSGMRVVIDGANGAGYKSAPLALRELDAEVIEIGTTPNGLNINHDCGSTSTQALSRKVRETRADLGIALDGDADRVMLVDEKGRLIDGDQVLALLATSFQEEGRLAKSTAVGTVMSNLGLDRYLTSRGIKLERTDVGDQYILRLMRDAGYNVGGEQSGHIILSDYSKTGDGLVAALQAMSVIMKSGTKASEACHCFTPVPQILRNVRYHEADGNPLENERIKASIAEAEAEMKGEARLLVRKSGTESLIRIMAEGDDKEAVTKVVSRIESLMKR